MRENKWVRGARVTDGFDTYGTLIEAWDHKSNFIKVKLDGAKDWQYSIAHHFKLARKRKAKV